MGGGLLLRLLRRRLGVDGVAVVEGVDLAELVGAGVGHDDVVLLALGRPLDE